MACITSRQTQHSFLWIVVLVALTQQSLTITITPNTNSSIPTLNLLFVNPYIFNSLYYTIGAQYVLYYCNSVILELLLIRTCILKDIIKTEFRCPWPLFLAPFYFLFGIRCSDRRLSRKALGNFFPAQGPLFLC